MKIQDSVALVTGANRGLGAAYAQALLDRGAARVYATARDPEKIADPRLVPLALDITDPASIAAAAEAARDVTLLVNNAGISTGTPITGDDAGLRAELETNFLGPVAVSRAFAPILAANGGGALVNVLSALAWVSLPGLGGYAAAKSAMWSATNALRAELHAQGTLVVAVHAGFLDTDMAAGVTGPKTAPDEIARLTLDGVEAGRYEILGDEVSRRIRAGLAGPIEGLYPALAH